MLDISNLPDPGPRRDVTTLALSLAYTSAEIAAALEYCDRKAPRTHPPGDFDNLGRFFAAERTTSVVFRLRPSAKWPFSEMLAARTATHCAELFDANEVKHVTRLARAFERPCAGKRSRICAAPHHRLHSGAPDGVLMRFSCNPQGLGHGSITIRRDGRHETVRADRELWKLRLRIISPPPRNPRSHGRDRSCRIAGFA